MDFGGNDIVAGGRGNDVFRASDGADDYHGGPARDTINYGHRSQPLTIDLDNVADDGQAGEYDNVRSNVENIVIGIRARRPVVSQCAGRRRRGGPDRPSSIPAAGTGPRAGGSNRCAR